MGWDGVNLCPSTPVGDNYLKKDLKQRQKSVDLIVSLYSDALSPDRFFLFLSVQWKIG
jgi:hypothetical protein